MLLTMIFLPFIKESLAIIIFAISLIPSLKAGGKIYRAIILFLYRNSYLHVPRSYHVSN